MKFTIPLFFCFVLYAVVGFGCGPESQKSVGVNHHANNPIEVHLPPQPTEEEAHFLATVEKAIVAKDVNALVALTYGDKDYIAPESMVWFCDSFYKVVVGADCISLTLDRVDSEKESVRKIGDTMCRESLPVRWIVTVNQVPQAPVAKVTERLRAGLLDGKIRLTIPTSLRSVKLSELQKK